jgi:hypothetical protein
MNRNQINSTDISTGISTQQPLAEGPVRDGNAQLEFHVTYLDSESGRIRTEVLDDAVSAERFASRVVRGEDDWAIVDPVPLQQLRIAA